MTSHVDYHYQPTLWDALLAFLWPSFFVSHVMVPTINLLFDYLFPLVGK
jgi:hypothetical protein